MPATTKKSSASVKITPEYFPLTEAVLDAPKKEITLTCLQEGPGNLKDRRWYSRGCVEGLESKVYSRRKVIINHLKEGDDEDLRNWFCTIKKTWTVEEGGRLHRKVKIKVHEDWLWTRCVEAPGEIALSIEGNGAGGPGVIEGEKWTVIESIPYLNAFKLVPYSGNSKMGLDLLEGAQNPEEDPSMPDFNKLTLAVLKENCSDLYDSIVKEAKAEADKASAKKIEEAKKAVELAEKAKNGDMKALEESFEKRLDARLAEQGKVIKSLTDSRDELLKRIDDKDVKERLFVKGALIDGLIEASSIPEEGRTKNFRAALMRLTEKKDGDKTVSVEEQAKAEIAEREKLCAGGEAQVRESGSDGGTKTDKIDPEKLNEAEKEIWENASFSGQNPDNAVRAHRATEAEKEKKGKEAGAAA